MKEVTQTLRVQIVYNFSNLFYHKPLYRATSRTFYQKCTFSVCYHITIIIDKSLTIYTFSVLFSQNINGVKEVFNDIYK